MLNLNNKSLHKLKAVESFRTASYAIKEGYMYPGYTMLKEAARGALSYINEDLQNKTYDTKTNMKTLLQATPKELLMKYDIKKLEIFNEKDKEGLLSINSMDIKELEEVRKLVKDLITTYIPMEESL